jgi:curved DNA-binding protein
MPGTPPGDQLVELSIRAPAAETKAQRGAYEALQAQFKAFDPRR